MMKKKRPARTRLVGKLLGFESLEARDLMAGLFYWADGKKVDLVESSTHIVAKLSDGFAMDSPNASSALQDLLTDYRATESIADDVWRFEKKSPIGPYATGDLETVAIRSPKLEWLTQAFVASEGGHQVLVIDELIVGLNADVEIDLLFEDLSNVWGELTYRPLSGTPNQFVVTLEDRTGREILEVANTLAEDARFDFAVPNTYQNVQRFSTPNDTLYPNQWHLNNTGSQIAAAVANADVNAPEAWDLSTGVGVTIAVIDDGMERTHPDLIDNIFINLGETAGNGIDDDGNGYIDDVSGWSFVTNGPNPSVGSNDEHGTSVAGVAAGRGNNNLGVAGAAYNAKILPVQIFNGGTFVGDAGAASAVYYAAGRTANGLSSWNAAQVINCSWGGGSPSTAITAAFTWANNNARGGLGTATFISSGNGYASAVSYPANLSSTLNGVMAVGASNQADLRSEYSNYGAAVDFVAPSSDIDSPITGGITTTDRTGSLGYNTGDYTNNTSANGFGGTSSASPLAAGVGALVLSLVPNMTGAQIRSTLRSTADKIGGVVYDANGFNLEYGYGRLNALAALQSLSMRPITTSPAIGSTISTLPNAATDYLVDFNFPFDQTPSAIDLSKFAVNGLVPIAANAIDADTLQIVFANSPVATEGIQNFSIAAGAVTRLSNGELSAALNGTFLYDITVLQVVSTSPPNLSILSLPGPFNVDFDFNEPVSASSIATNDLTVSTGTVSAATLIDDDTVRYTLSNLVLESTLSVTLNARSVTDLNGLSNPNSVPRTYFVDRTTIVFPVAFTARNPIGSLVYEASTSGVIGTSGDSDGFNLELDPGQTLSVIVTSTSSTLQSQVRLVGPGEVVLATNTANAVNQAATLQSIAVTAGGTYRIEVSGAGTTTGAYLLRPILNTAFENEGTIANVTNHTPATAQNLNGSFVTVGPPLLSAEKVSVMGVVDSRPNGGFDANAVTPTFNDISLTGTKSTVAIGDDAFDTLSSTQLSGFVFPFYGANYTSLHFSTNGLITFGSGSSGFSNGNLSTSPSQAAIAVLWDDLNIDNTGTGIDARNVFWQVVGSGLNQQVIVQWNNVRLLSGTVYFSFQAVLSRDGSIQTNYGAGVVVTSATVGVKAAGTSNPLRRVVHVDQSAGQLVGPNLSTRWIPTVPTPDLYGFDLNARDRVSLGVGASVGNVDLQLIASDGITVLAAGVVGSTNWSETIQNVPILSGGTYYARITGDIGVTYFLTVARNAGLDSEANNSSTSAQLINGLKGVFGAKTSTTTSDWYSIDLFAGQNLRLESSTLGDGPGLFTNVLNPHLELFDPSGTQVAVGATTLDGRNESINYVVPTTGRYRILAGSDSNTLGEYFVGIAVTGTTVVDRRLFYNGSNSTVFGNGSGNPVNATDTNLVPLLPGQTSGPSNYSNYMHGINGLLIDIANSPFSISASDFEFETWDGMNPTGFVALTAVPTVTLIPGAGLFGTDRIKIELPNGAVRNTWLRVRLLGNGNTGLSSPDVFYFGNSVGDMYVGNLSSPDIVRVNATDTAMVRQNQSPSPNSVPITHLYDINKDGRVNATDTGLVRQNQSASSIGHFTAPL